MTKFQLTLCVCVMMVTLFEMILADTSEDGTVTVDKCQLPKETGPCKGLFPRYFYNGNTTSCEYFVYGGCYGNDNNFETEKLCQTACVTSK